MNIFHYPLTTYPSYFSASSDPLYKVIARTPCLTFAELGGGSPIPRTHQWLTRVGVGGGEFDKANGLSGGRRVGEGGSLVRDPVDFKNFRP